MTHRNRPPDAPAAHRARPTEMVRAVIGWVVENDRKFRVAQSMVEDTRRIY